MAEDYQEKLLAGWEETYKKGQLTLWIMLALLEGPKHMAAIKVFINKSTNNALVADDKSMYRALRRYYGAGLIDFVNKPGSGGPNLKIYGLTEIGKSLLKTFLKKNISEVFYKAEIKNLIKNI